MRRIGIVGAGFAGLAAAWHLSQIGRSQSSSAQGDPDDNPIQITLIDQKGLGAGASGVSAGLLHPFAGKQAKKNWMGDEGFSATMELIHIAQAALDQAANFQGVKPELIIEQRGILRLAVTQRQQADFQLALKMNPELEWWDSDRCASVHEGIESGIPGLYIPNGIAVNAPLYLKGLWLACEQAGVKFEISRVNSIESLIRINQFDLILVTSGFHTKELLPDLPLTPVKGQVATFDWPHHLAPLPFPLNSRGYLIYHPTGKCTAGATFERKFNVEEVEPEVAISEIKGLIAPFFALIEQWEPNEIRSGIRASTPSKLPLLGEVKTNVWVATGLGSKGLLYHAWIGRVIAEAMVYHRAIPLELQISP
jgi:glycine/D-amino acid oxidase-like deaminating enzyme